MNTPKAVIYARFSSHAQNEQSIDGQLRVNYEYAQREGYTVIGEYIDRATSGTSTIGRPEFQRMIKDAAKKQFQYILVYKLDRFTRNRYDSAVYKHKLKQLGIKVVSSTESISDNPEGIILEAILEASAEYYSQELSQKVKRGNRESLLKGQHLGGFVPLGYKAVNKKIEICDKTAPIIKFVFEEYSQGKSMKSIVEALKSLGYRSPKGKEFNIKSFQHNLKSKIYIGIKEYNGVEYDNIYPPLIDEDTFNLVQEKLKLNSTFSKKSEVPYVLKSKIFCGHCGSSMIGESGRSSNGKTHRYYTCNKRKNSKSCDKKPEHKDYIEWFVVDKTINYVLSNDHIEYIAERVVSIYDSEFGNDTLKNMQNQLKQITAESDKYFQKAMESNDKALTKKYEAQVSALELQREELELDIYKLQAANKVKLKKEDIIAWLKYFCQGDVIDPAFQQRIIDTFINNVYVYDDKIVIYYNIKDSEQVNYIDNCSTVETFEHKKTSNHQSDVRMSEEMAPQVQTMPWLPFLLIYVMLPKTIISIISLS